MRAALGQREEDDGTTCPVGPEAAHIARCQAVRITLLSLVLGVGAAAGAWCLASVFVPG